MKSKSRRSIPAANGKGGWVSPRFFSCLPVLLVQAFPLFPFKLPVILIVFNRIVVNDC